MSIPKNIFADTILQLLIQKYSPIPNVYVPAPVLLKYWEMESLSKTENKSIYKGGGWWVKIMDHYYSLKCLYFSQYSSLKNLI